MKSAEELDMQEFWPVVHDVMALSFAEGFENRPVRKEALELGWSPFRRQMFKIDKFLQDQGFEQISDSFGTVALQELARLNASLRGHVNAVLTAPNTREFRIALRKLLSMADARLKTIIRTAAHSMLAAGHYLADQQPAVRDQIWGYQYVTQADERVRDEHWAMHGVIQPKDHEIWNVWWPPNGWNCRCILVTLFEEYVTVAPDTIDGGLPMPDPGFAFNPATLVAI